MKSTHKVLVAALIAVGVVACGKEEAKPAPKVEPAKAVEVPSVTVTIAHAGPLTGVIGVIGPTRMPYDKVISLVTHTSELVTDLLKENPRNHG